MEHPSESFTETSSTEAQPPNAVRSGFVAIVGRPNAGKSTLINYLVGEKIAAVSNKPQTTRTRILGIVTRPEGQVVFVDTPGVHKPGYRLNKRMMQSVLDALATVDVVVLLRDASVSTGNGDRFVLDLVRQSGRPALLALNKTDRLGDKGQLLKLIDFYRNELDFLDYVPISALTGEGTDTLLHCLLNHLPLAPPPFAEDDLTDQTERTLVAEFLREQLLRRLSDELPFVVAVAVEKWEERDDGGLNLACVILVERQSQRAIVLGRGGLRLRDMATAARAEIEAMLERKVFLEIFVKVEPHWRNDERRLDELGIH
ncbi:MAG: GTPase Era [Chloracidobacterium sp.]|uniref:GTPase Era n=1 Tax=Chloracidobacterium validum TaxID=2821543 RepID=A0ABX8BAI4_9BACT|nr:GTPase Era [Chloracidobacterium validum]QUW03679.1 GTPase Era [Chloracidobacterium validum]